MRINYFQILRFSIYLCNFSIHGACSSYDGQNSIAMGDRTSNPAYNERKIVSKQNKHKIKAAHLSHVVMRIA